MEVGFIQRDARRLNYPKVKFESSLIVKVKAERTYVGFSSYIVALLLRLFLFYR